MSYKSLDIANKILAMPTYIDDGELISNLKLQKLLYYVQGFNLACFGEPLFDEGIEAWQYGPVVPSVYNHFSEYGSNGIAIDKNKVSIINLKEAEENLFDRVYKIYNEFSAIGLMNLTHSESPWKSTPTGKGRAHIISEKKLSAFFKTRLK